ncbi:ModE family transcriptional regulator [Candidatus Sulfurimonas marisnigri]|uniref:ModE family transcriptional regulator n=1 Tax=Candidatus Sulfurimonas marisnigri TaxID=2740405 RepID=A0A7S7M3B9_9BACT|nr:ModE family transcriptional regulator [Candidatus Sulfurimonas marisnigri]
MARELHVEPKEIAELTKKHGIRIDNCELGVFGSKDFGDARDDIYEKLSAKANAQKKLDCSAAWEVAQEFSLNKVGSTTKKSDIEVIYCQLGCFRTRIHHGSKS